MEVWTIQDESVWNDISRDGVYRVADENTYPYLDFQPGKQEEPEPSILICYKWMANQLCKKTGEPAPAGHQFPIWGWIRQWDSKSGKPDMRSWTTNEPEEVVRLRLEIPEERLLLSSFDLWHMPLNRGYCSLTREEDTHFDLWCEAVGIDRFQRGIWDFSKQSHVMRKARREVFRSWENVLWPFPETYDEDWVGNLDKDAVQAVFWEIRKEDVVSCEHFTTRKAARY